MVSNKKDITDPYIKLSKIFFVFFLSKKHSIHIRGIIIIKPYAAGVCFDKKDKQKNKGIKIKKK